MLWHFEALHMGSLQGKINTLCVRRLLCIAMIQISNQACGNVWKVFIKPQAMRWKFSALATSEVKVSVEIEPDFFPDSKCSAIDKRGCLQSGHSFYPPPLLNLTLNHGRLWACACWHFLFECVTLPCDRAWVKSQFYTSQILLNFCL